MDKGEMRARLTGKYLTAAELSEILEVPRRTLWRWAGDGWVPARRISRRGWRFDGDLVLAVLEGKIKPFS